MSAGAALSGVNFAVGRNIRARREALRLSQMELSEMTNIGLTRLQSYESGVEPLLVAELLDICRGLDCTPESLLPTGGKRSRETRGGEYVPRWMADARALNALHPRLFDTLTRLPENRLRLMLISMQGMCHAQTAHICESDATKKASA
ncbi:helix-turn-helix transcriptional regulator [Asticcacaulis sp. 201]|uniref:helix-turn-helix domain-containing protein n=1 Tax=Asticcacaulis sp. 201 TaxID=3028787 RepID=UPI002916A948|nr:helix-turn-helix transcriptional regulator [Asticcacaulis sp. 201]MDV6331733.1 helix-turn-helix transcriptional regulator [Asticcacaulis sp. 201]